MKTPFNLKFFTYWFGLGIPPFLIGTVVVAFNKNVPFGVVTSIVVVAWIWDTLTTTCRRCSFYGTTKCGIPGMVTPMLLKKRSPFDISVRRVKLHYYADVAMIVYVNYVYWHVPMIFPIVLICSVIGWFVVFQPKRFHGLLFRLQTKNNE
jgi:hypothetical protein